MLWLSTVRWGWTRQAIFTAWVAAALGAHCAPSVLAAERVEVLEEFSMPPGGDFVTIPVTIRGKSYEFLLDTYDSVSLFDTSLVDDLALTPIEGDSTANSDEDKQYHAPVATIGRLRVELGAHVWVRSLDYSRQRIWSNHVGHLSLDALNATILQINFEEGKVRFLSAVPPDAGTAYPFANSKLNRADPGPRLLGRVAGKFADRFRIATTFAGSVGLSEELYQACVDHRLLIDPEISPTFDVAANSSNRTGRIPDFELAGEKPVRECVQVTGENAIGLSILCRYDVVFDFPTQRVFLKRNSRGADRTGVHEADLGIELARRKDHLVISGLDPGLLADRAGLCVDDEIQLIDGAAPRPGSRWYFVRQLGRNWGRSELTIKRDREVLKIRTESQPSN